MSKTLKNYIKALNIFNFIFDSLIVKNNKNKYIIFNFILIIKYIKIYWTNYIVLYVTMIFAKNVLMELCQRFQ